MPNVKSAKKRVRTNEKRRILNRQKMSAMRTALRAAQGAIAEGDMPVAEEKTRLAIKLVNRYARKGIIHRNKASRQESRLMKRLNAAKSA
jgi:small subunit ribosomal protein S20